jgi:hypothetical protein
MNAPHRCQTTGVPDLTDGARRCHPNDLMRVSCSVRGNGLDNQ